MNQCDFYLDISGNHQELGRAHGEAFRGVIQEAVARWEAEFSEATRLPFEQLITEFNEATGYIRAIQQHAPHLLEEVYAVADGSDLPRETIYTWQLVDELIDYCIEYIYMEKCTTLGAYGQREDAAPVVGKTQDLNQCYRDAAVLVRTRNPQTGLDVFNSTVAGIICQDGMSRNIALCCNHVGHLDRNPLGLPVTYVTRLALERAGNCEEASAIFADISHASGMNYAIADRHQTRTFEVSANDLVEYLPAPELKRLWHTNHPVSNENYCRDIAMWNRMSDSEAARTYSRLDYAKERMSAVDSVTVATLKDILSSRETPISHEAGDDFYTINSVIMEMADSPRLWFSPGPPSRVNYEEFGFGD